MNLVEVMLAGLVFALASAGSLEVMAGLGRALGGEQQAELAGERLEAELRRSQAQVRAGAQQQPFAQVHGARNELQRAVHLAARL